LKQVESSWLSMSLILTLVRGVIVRLLDAISLFRIRLFPLICHKNKTLLLVDSFSVRKLVVLRTLVFLSRVSLLEKSPTKASEIFYKSLPNH